MQVTIEFENEIMDIECLMVAKQGPGDFKIVTKLVMFGQSYNLTMKAPFNYQSYEIIWVKGWVDSPSKSEPQATARKVKAISYCDACGNQMNYMRPKHGNAILEM